MVRLQLRMPTRYKRTGTCSRASWTEQQLSKAIKAVNENRLGVNEAARAFGVPATTLRRRKSKNNTRKGPLGPSSTLGDDVEAKIFGKAEGVSINRALGMNRKDVDGYFKLLEQIITENSLIGKPGHIFNMDETGLQLNNKPGHVIAKKGSKNIVACNLYIKNNPGRKLTRLQFGQLLGDAWNKSATVNNAASAFRATGIVPFNPLAIPDYAFLTEHANVDIHETEVQNEAAMEVQNEAAMEVQNEAAMEEQNEVGMEEQHEPRAESPNKKTPEKCTPGKMLDNISPVPVVSASMNSVRRRGKHLAEILTESQTIVEKKIKQPREHKEREKNRDSYEAT
ncbi:hypothetical protein NQ318_020381 [Aromia moschata]|uniref:HTH psq-type domain-containing protein n=1 Tax=Aromia moschata TaxID=1265417 RepID=A0AAV8Y2T1_9CUCU|nr:hypothetical protein NQ318_020381 [Aromia moschata]